MHECTFVSRPLVEEDLPLVLELCLGNPLYYGFIGEKPTIESLAVELGELPPGCSPEQKRTVGYFDRSGKLAAFLDLVYDYPDERCAYIGLFMVAIDFQGRGVGTAIVNDFLVSLHARGFSRVRLAYVQGNWQSQTFWEKCGFVQVGKPVAFASYAAVPMERVL